MTAGLTHPSDIDVMLKGQAEKVRIISFGLQKYACMKSQSERLRNRTRTLF